MPRITKQDALEKLRERAPEVFGPFSALRSAAFRDGEVPRKHKAFAAALVSAVKGCGACAEMYLRLAHESGGRCEEFVEYLGVLVALDGCVGEQRAAEMALRWKEIAHCCEEEKPSSSGGCCGP